MDTINISTTTAVRKHIQTGLRHAIANVKRRIANIEKKGALSEYWINQLNADKVALDELENIFKQTI